MQTVVVLLFVLVLGLSKTVESNSNVNGSSLIKLCRDENVPIRTAHYLLWLDRETKDPDLKHGCEDYIVHAIEELALIVDKAKACSKDGALKIVSFSDKYLRDREGVKKLPKRLSDFAIAYGMEMSRKCRAFMIKHFLRQANIKLTSEDYIDAEQFAGANSPIGRLLDPITSVGDFILPSDLKQAVPGLEGEKFYVQVKSSHTFDRIKEVCQKRFQPLYEESVLPIAYLARSGFDHKHWNPKQLTHFWLNQRGHFWTRIVFLCEYLKDVEYVEAPKESGDDAFKVMLKRNLELVRDKSIVRLDDYTPIAYVTGQVLGKYDYLLRSSVEHFDANKEPVQRIQEKILKSSFSLIREQLKYGNIKSLLVNMVEEIVLKDNDDKKQQEKIHKQLKEILEAENYPKLYRGIKSFGKWAMMAPLFAYIFVLAMPIISKDSFEIIHDLDYDYQEKLGHLDASHLI